MLRDAVALATPPKLLLSIQKKCSARRQRGESFGCFFMNENLLRTTTKDEKQIFLLQMLRFIFTPILRLGVGWTTDWRR